jgi:two-component system phosphate regulon response regulator PhoB
MSRAGILVVDDEEDLLEVVRYNLSREGYAVTCVATGEAAVSAVRSKPPDLIILDLMLPGIDGLDVCRTLKRDPRTSGVPIIMLTAKGEESDVVVGLELGADDYITKPFSPRVLSARVGAVLRRAATAPAEDAASIRVDELEIDPRRHEAQVEGKPVTLTATEFRILHYLAKRRGWVFTRDQILNAVQSTDYPVTDRSVDVHIVALRRKLGHYGELIETVRGVGYRFQG